MVTQPHALARLIEAVKTTNEWSDPDIAARARAKGHNLSKSNISRIRSEAPPMASITRAAILGLADGLGVSIEQVATAALDSMGITIPRFDTMPPEQAVRLDAELSEKDKRIVLSLLSGLRDDALHQGVVHVDLPATDPPASTEGTQDQASEDQKTVVQIGTLADQLKYFADSAERTVQAASDLHELDPLAPPNPQLAYMLRKQVGWWQDQIDAADAEDRITLQIELDRALQWISKFPSEQELKAKIREAETLAQGGNLAPDEGKPHDLRGTPAPVAPTPDLRTAGAWPDGEPVGFSTYPRWLDWRNAGEPDDWEAYRRGVPNESHSTSTANSDGPDRWPDGEPVYNGDDRANWKSWRRAGEPADWETYRDGRQEDVELIGGPGAARDLGTEPTGRKIRRRQDVAAEQPDTDGPEGGA